MGMLDIIIVLCFVSAVLICTVKGFMNILIKIGAWFISFIIAKALGAPLGQWLFGSLFGVEGSGSVADTVKSSIATLLGTLIVFAVSVIIICLVLGRVEKLLVALPGVGVANRLLGALFGFVIALGTVFLFTEAVRIVATVLSAIDPTSDIYEQIGQTLVFKYFYSEFIDFGR